MYVKSDNGPEFIAQRVTTWLHAQHVATHFIAPGSPWQNGHNESFNGVLRYGCLSRWLFTSVHEARRIMTHWREEYNHERPHGALDGLSTGIRSAVQRSSSGACCMRISNIETGRVTLGLTLAYGDKSERAFPATQCHPTPLGINILDRNRLQPTANRTL